MFESIKSVLSKARNLQPDKMLYSIYIRNDIKRIIINLNRINQLTKGLNSEGETIGVYSVVTDITSENTVFTFEGNRYEKIAGEPYNFVDTGDFFKSFQVQVDGDGFVIVADDNKENETLTDKYGENILGLTRESLNELGQKIIPLLIDKTRKEIFK